DKTIIHICFLSKKNFSHRHRKFYALQQVSIHAPTRGATMDYIKLSRKLLVSIHAPTRGATAS
ncbi:hypothetical protein, partial [Blautia sp. An249]|uniref:hypothetical protein n=1 Tax=Blautia sp. An249 TaxID=1965603 RepID=UPI0019513195